MINSELGHVTTVAEFQQSIREQQEAAHGEAGKSGNGGGNEHAANFRWHAQALDSQFWASGFGDGLRRCPDAAHGQQGHG